MNATEAQAALRKLFGKAAAWRYDEKATKADEREELRAALPELSARANAAKEALEAKRAELLRDPEYVRLRNEARAASDARDRAHSRICHHRVTVGRANGMFFEVVAEGDNWQDAIDAARAKATG